MKKFLATLLLLCSTFVAADTNFSRMISGVNVQAGTTYQFTAADITKLVIFTSSSPVAVTLPKGTNAGYGLGSIFAAQNIGTGTVTITCSTCNISGASTLILTTGNGAEIWSAGSDYYAHLGGGASGGSMTWPSTPGIAVCTGTPCTAWTTSLVAPSGTVVGTTDSQTLSNKIFASPSFTGTPDASGAAQFKHPIAAGFATLANGEMGFDTTNNNWHFWQAADVILAPLAPGFVSGHCGQPTSSSGKWQIADSGAACGTGSGANAALSNLASVAVNLPLSPGADNSITLNDPAKRYTNAWFNGVVGNSPSGTPASGLTFQAAGVTAVGNGTLNDTSGTLNGGTGNFGSGVSVGAGSAVCGTNPFCVAFVFGNSGSLSPAANNGFFQFDLASGHIKLSLGSTAFDSFMNYPYVPASVTGAFTGCTYTVQFLGADGNCHLSAVVLKVGPSNFTTAGNTSLQIISGLTSTMPASTAGTVGFNCNIAWSQATGTAAVAFGVQGATTAPTNLEADGTMYPSATTLQTGTLTALTTTTATSVVSVSPSVITTIWRAVLTGTLEFPSNASPTVLNIMVSTATSGDAVTVYRGSKCVLNFQ